MAALTTKTQVSAGGVVYRGRQVALIATAGGRWQLPKGMVEPGEAPEEAAAREVREEAGVVGELVAPLPTIEYWYVAKDEGVRYHKFVRFYLFRYVSGDVADHDDEVLEARWVDLGEAALKLTYPNERKVLAQAAELILREVGGAG
ncbi:MAG TPA: NUDIX domain-containing protein [Trueperaceae bacterium]|nr:NUDIX domain-containing protein [Trueperaceae bacterium]